MDFSQLSLAPTAAPAAKKEGKKNVWNRTLGAVPSPVRTVVRGGLDLMDTPRAATMSAVKEIRDLNNSRSFSFSDLVQQTRDNISAYEALDLQRLGKWGSLAGLGVDLVVGAKTMPGSALKELGAGRFARAEKAGATLLARDAAEAATLASGESLSVGTGAASVLANTKHTTSLLAGKSATDAVMDGARAAIHELPEHQDAVRLGAKLLTEGVNSLTAAELATVNKARTLTLGGRAIPGTEALANKIAGSLHQLMPARELAVAKFTKQGYDLVPNKVTGSVDRVASAEAGRFAQNFDVFGQTGSRLRAAALEAKQSGDYTRLTAELEATTLRSKGLGVGSTAAADLVNGGGAIAAKGVRGHIADVFGVTKTRKALAEVRAMADRGAGDLLDGLAGPVAPGNKIGIVARKTMADVYAMAPQYWADNPDEWGAAVASLIKKADEFGARVTKANSLPNLLGSAKLAAAGDADVLSNVLAPWAQLMGKEVSASMIADPDALMRLSAANDLGHIAAGGKTIKLRANGWVGDISEETFKRVTGTYGGTDEIAKFTRHFQGVTNIFKTTALASPAFSNRNFIGGVLNNFANGVTLLDTRWAAKQYKAWESGVGKVDPAFLGFIQRQGTTGFTRGVEENAFGGRTTNFFQGMQKGLDRTGLSARGVMTGTMNVKAPTEAVLRGAAFRRGLTRGLTEEGAYAFASKIHIDYQDLSSFDVAARRVMPFSMWATRNPALQAEYAARGMGSGTALETSMANSQESHAGDAFPPFIAGGALALGGGRTLDLSATPSADLFKPFDSNTSVGGVIKDKLAEFNPVMQAFIEQPTGRELGTGRPTTGWRTAASFFPPLTTLAAGTSGTPLSSLTSDELRSRSQMPGWMGKLGLAGSPFQVRQY